MFFWDLGERGLLNSIPRGIGEWKNGRDLGERGPRGSQWHPQPQLSSFTWNLILNVLFGSGGFSGYFCCKVIILGSFIIILLISILILETGLIWVSCSLHLKLSYPMLEATHPPGNVDCKFRYFFYKFVICTKIDFSHIRTLVFLEKLWEKISKFAVRKSSAWWKFCAAYTLE